MRVAAGRILAGDDSTRAANDLEGAIVIDHEDDDDYDELVWALSMYSPRAGHPYLGPEELRAEILGTLGPVESPDGADP